MPLYRLVPVPDSDDTNWGRALNQGEVVVRARSSGEARALAAFAEAAAVAGPPVRATTQVHASAFMDEKLYSVRTVPPGPEPDFGPRGVIQAAFEKPPGYVAIED